MKPAEIRTLAVAILTLLGLTCSEAQAQNRPATSGRVVLVELFTSQGCDMCPTAEKILGELADSNRSVAPIALHVDYFNKPWKDPFSDSLISDRQMSYHKTYKGQKDPQLGLYYTPMIMVDGMSTVNGRDPVRLRAAVASARKKPPSVNIQATPDRKSVAGKFRLAVSVTPLNERLKGRDQLLCAIMRDDKVLTVVESGENHGKTLNNRFPARKMKFETIHFESKSAQEIIFDFESDAAWDQSKLSVVVFVQDVITGEVHQTAVIPVSPKS